jgi:hypothetical protein
MYQPYCDYAYVSWVRVVGVVKEADNNDIRAMMRGANKEGEELDVLKLHDEEGSPI